RPSRPWPKFSQGVKSGTTSPSVARRKLTASSIRRTLFQSNTANSAPACRRGAWRAPISDPQSIAFDGRCCRAEMGACHAPLQNADAELAVHSQAMRPVGEAAPPLQNDHGE